MTPTKHNQCNDVLRAPEGDPNCEDLHICRENGEVWSFWTPTAEEIAAIVKGGPIALRVAGATHPPLSLHVMVPDYKANEGKTTDPAQILALYEANRERCNALVAITKRAISALVKATGHKHQPLYDEFLDLATLNSFQDDIVRELVPGEEKKAAESADNVRTNETAPE